MGFYADQVVPRAVGLVCGTHYFRPWRQRVCEGLSGDIVEIGFGSGANLAFLPASVRRVVAVEPALVARRLAGSAASRSAAAISFVEVEGGRLPLEDDSLDGALCTFTLCTVQRPDIVLGEIRRVLKPGGALHFLEHGLAPDARTAKWQRRLNGWEQRLAGGCQLTRDAATLVRDAGLEIEAMEQRYAGGPRPWTYFTLGVARKPRG
ncbi:MAG: class I SAM-dependent methyltransferase [Acidobacteria bacterium]|nr:class I SAM-dependent methyltransferase [Acidobacteriota bacterium]